MALITCPDCGGSVSDAAPACVHCGRPVAARAGSSKNVALVVYVLELLLFFYLIPGVLGGVIAYLKRGEARGTWVESHFDWLISTSRVSLGGAVAAVLAGVATAAATESPIAALLPMGAIGIGLMLWYLYRPIRGGLALSDERPIG